jgi:hypothetical protein
MEMKSVITATERLGAAVDAAEIEINEKIETGRAPFF